VKLIRKITILLIERLLKINRVRRSKTKRAKNSKILIKKKAKEKSLRNLLKENRRTQKKIKSEIRRGKKKRKRKETLKRND
jgi:hypothetical protein